MQWWRCHACHRLGRSQVVFGIGYRTGNHMALPSIFLGRFYDVKKKQQGQVAETSTHGTMSQGFTMCVSVCVD